MTRVLPLLICAALLTACNPESGEPSAPDAIRNSDQSTTKPETGPAPVTGSPMFRRDSDGIARALKDLQKTGRPSDADDLASFEREVRMVLRHIDVTLRALEVGIGAESRQIVEKSHKALLAHRQVTDKKIDGLWREITEIRDVLEGSAKGTDAIPPGFTEDELKDRLADLESAVRTERGKRSELNTELDECAKLLNSKAVPEQGATTLTEERGILRELRKQAEKLLRKG